MRKITSLVITLLILPFTSFAQTENSWVKKADFGGLDREKAIAFSIGELGYVSCGVDTAEITHNDLWEYNPEMDTWSQMASIPAPERRNPIGFSIAGKGYVGTGFTLDDGSLGEKLKDFWEYDPVGNSWTEKAHYPGGGDTGIYQATGFALAGNGYVACGKIGPDAYIGEFWEYNPDTDIWTQRTPFPGGERYQLMSFVIEDKAFVGLGTDRDVFRKDFYAYNPTSNTWEILPDFPGTERAKGTSFSIGVKGFLVFGTDGGLKDELWEYNYYTGSWTMRAPFPGGGRVHGVAFSIGDKGYAGIGKEVTGKKQSIYEYTPAGPLSLLEESADYLNVYPNPVEQYARIVVPESLTNGFYTIHNLQGEIVRQDQFYSNNFEIERNDLAQGYYQLTITNASGIPVGMKKIVIL